ncbi:MAG: thymidine phosphorylase [Verrucomicrobiota bacterium]
MFPVDFIKNKRDSKAHAPEEIQQFIQAMTAGKVADYQISAWLMAAYLNGLNPAETSALTQAMTRSGEMADLSHITKPRIDKHSTGGVGDKVSLVLAPLAAACGLCVPMMSGRGLGHTGGTLDKLDSIPGFSWQMSLDRYARQCEEIDCALIGQTEGMVPADRKLYSLRDVTSTVESIPLISASIMSKKLAEGIEGLVLDVKVGSGAFMKSVEEAEELAESMINIGRRLGCDVRAVISRMDQPLGHTVGNALEVREAIECIQGFGPDDLLSLSIDLVGHMLEIGKIVDSLDAGQDLAEKAIKNGSAARKFAQIISAQGGPDSLDKILESLPEAPHRHPVYYRGTSGIITEVNAMKIARGALQLGAGRIHAESVIDLSVGFSELVKVGEILEEGSLISTIHAVDQDSAEKAEQALIEAITVESLHPMGTEPLIIEVLPR